MEDGTKLGDFWDRRSYYSWIITRQIMGQIRWLLGQEKLILSHNKMNYRTKRGDFLGQEKLILGHN